MGRQRSNWDHTSAVLATMVNCHNGNDACDPNKIHPFPLPKPVSPPITPAKGSAAPLRMFCKPENLNW